MKSFAKGFGLSCGCIGGILAFLALSSVLSIVVMVGMLSMATEGSSSAKVASETTKSTVSKEEEDRLKHGAEEFVAIGGMKAGPEKVKAMEDWKKKYPDLADNLAKKLDKAGKK